MQINFLCQGYRIYHGAAAWGETHHFALSYLVMIRLMQNGMSTLKNAATGIHGTSILGFIVLKEDLKAVYRRAFWVFSI